MTSTPEVAQETLSGAAYMSHSEQLYAILKGNWQPDDDDLHALMLNGPNDDGKRLFSWLRTDHKCPMTYEDVRPQPSMGTWCVVDTTLVLCNPNERIEYTVEHNGTKITLTGTDGTSRRFTRTGHLLPRWLAGYATFNGF